MKLNVGQKSIFSSFLISVITLACGDLNAATKPEPLDNQTGCINFYTSSTHPAHKLPPPGAIIRATYVDAEDPYSLICTWDGAAPGTHTQYNPNLACAKNSRKTAILIHHKAHKYTWACVEADSEIQSNTTQISLPAPPISVASAGIEIDSLYRKFFETNIVALQPRPFNIHASTWNLLRANIGKNGVSAYEVNFSQETFGKNLFVLLVPFFDEPIPSQSQVDAVINLSDVFDNLKNNDPLLAKTFEKVIIFSGGLQKTRRSLISGLIDRGFQVYGADPKLEYRKHAMYEFKVPVDFKVAVVDRHGYLRAFFDPVGVATANNRPEGERTRASRWLKHVFESSVSSDLGRETSLEQLILRTVHSGKFVDSLDSLPDRISVPENLIEQIKHSLNQQDVTRKEFGAILSWDGEKIYINSSSANDESGATYTSVFESTEPLLNELFNRREICADANCRQDFDRGRIVLGVFHTHPVDLTFSGADLIYSSMQPGIDLLATKGGDIYLAVATQKSILPGTYHTDSSSHSHRVKGFYLKQSSNAPCSQSERFLEIAKNGADQLGVGLYKMNGGVFVKINTKSNKTSPNRPNTALNIFDSSGQIIDPVDRLRIAVLLRSKMQASHLILDISAADAFDPALSAKSRSYFNGSKITSKDVDTLFHENYLTRQKSLNNKGEYGAYTFPLGDVSRQGDNHVSLIEKWQCDQKSFDENYHIVWGLKEQNLSGSDLEKKTSDLINGKSIFLMKSKNRSSDLCDEKLVFTYVVAGERFVDSYCKNGSAYRDIMGRYGNSTTRGQPLSRWR